MKKSNKDIIYKSLFYGSFLGGITMWLIQSTFDISIESNLTFDGSLLKVNTGKIVMTIFWIIWSPIMLYFSYKKSSKLKK